MFVGVGRFSGDHKIGRLFGGASPWGFALGLRLGALAEPGEKNSRSARKGEIRFCRLGIFLKCLPFFLLLTYSGAGTTTHIQW